MIKFLIRPFIPPIVSDVKNHFLRKLQERDIFRGHSTLFKNLISDATVYGEYGCGASSVWVATNTTIPINSVDTSLDWINNVKTKVGGRGNITFTHADLGELGEWGRPKNYEFRSKINDYLEGIWANENKPDLVLVDGRFRVACFLTSLLKAKPGAFILFDDYVKREYYHLVQDFVAVADVCGDQALFIVPEKLDRNLVEKERNRFAYVMD